MSNENVRRNIRDLKALYSKWRKAIETRLKVFETVYEEGSDEEIFAELVFCLLTPQSKALLCWDTVETLCQKDLLLKGSSDRLSNELNRVRFKNTKAENIIEARTLFKKVDRLFIKERLDSFGSSIQGREWLVTNVRGLGYKEAGHFLRNIGKGHELAILDRHILRNMLSLGVIAKVPSSLSKKRYLELEARLKEFSKNVSIPLDHLDLLLWCKETGGIFK